MHVAPTSPPFCIRLLGRSIPTRASGKAPRLPPATRRRQRPPSQRPQVLDRKRRRAAGLGKAGASPAVAGGGGGAAGGPSRVPARGGKGGAARGPSGRRVGVAPGAGRARVLAGARGGSRAALPGKNGLSSAPSVGKGGGSAGAWEAVPGQRPRVLSCLERSGDPRPAWGAPSGCCGPSHFVGAPWCCHAVQRVCANAPKASCAHLVLMSPINILM